MTQETQNLEITRMNRWETACCNFLFNSDMDGTVPTDENSTIAQFNGQYKLVGDCPGCGESHTEITKLTSLDE